MAAKTTGRPPAVFLTIVFCCVAGLADAAAEQFSETGREVTTQTGDRVALANGNILVTHAQSHASPVDDKTGVQTSEWCNFDSLLDAKETLVQFVGYCTRVYDGGDLMWISITGKSAEASEFTILGGTGKFAGATGGGTSKVISTDRDGRENTFKNIGTLTTK
jgi:hypothetical protein